MQAFAADGRKAGLPAYTENAYLSVRPDKKGKSDDDTNSISSGDGASFVTQGTAPPAYSAVSGPLGPAGAFVPTLELQVDTGGYAMPMLCSLFSSGASRSSSGSSSSGFMGRTSDAATVYVVDPADANWAAGSAQPAFVSLRTAHGSGSCALVAGAGCPFVASSPNPTTALRTLSTTTYRFGPGRPPRIALGGDLAPPDPEQQTPWDAFAVENASVFSRSQRLQTRLGTFEWRYAGRAERKALSAALVGTPDAPAAPASAPDKNARKQAERKAKEERKRKDVTCLLVLDRIATEEGAGGKVETRRPVARLVRNAELRTPGTTRYSEGNGGRLQLDLRSFATAGDAALERDMLVVLVVSSAICMLKKEVDVQEGVVIAAVLA